MRWATPYESARSCTGSPRPGARALLAWGLETYRDAYSLGIYNCRTVVGGSTTSTHGEGRAVDLGLPVGDDGQGTPLGRSIVARIGAHGARLGVQAIVYDRTVWSAISPAGRPYRGTHPHYDHLHIEMIRQAADRLTLATFRAVLGGAEAEEDDMREGDRGSSVLWWQHRLNVWAGIDVAADGVFGPATTAATKEFQRARGLEQTGTVAAVDTAELAVLQLGGMIDRHAADGAKHAGGGLDQAAADRRYVRKDVPVRIR